MSKPNPSSITLEEAVARMVNLDYIPTGFTLLEMTSAFLEEAEVDYENARIDRLPDDQITSLKTRMDACNARHSLAQLLMVDLRQEIDDSESGLVKVSSDSTSQVRLTLESVASWASDKYGIGIPEWSHAGQDADHSVQTVRWEDITIKIYAEYKIGCFYGNNSRKQSHFRDIGLMGLRKNATNNLGAILIALSRGAKFPTATKPANKDKTALSKLRSALEQLTGISSDPFYAFNEGDGWKPRFKLIDDRRNAHERAKERAIHVALDEARDFDSEDDTAGDWLEKNG
jgi:hypothetical protein